MLGTTISSSSSSSTQSYIFNYNSLAYFRKLRSSSVLAIATNAASDPGDGDTRTVAIGAASDHNVDELIRVVVTRRAGVMSLAPVGSKLKRISKHRTI